MRKENPNYINMIKKIIKEITPLIDILFLPLTFLSSLWLLIVRTLGLKRMMVSNKIFNSIGLLPIHNHYYQPLINPNKHNLKSLRDERIIGGLDLNINKQKEIISSFNYVDELLKFPKKNLMVMSSTIIMVHSKVEIQSIYTTLLESLNQIEL